MHKDWLTVDCFLLDIYAVLNSCAIKVANLTDCGIGTLAADLTIQLPYGWRGGPNEGRTHGIRLCVYSISQRIRAHGLARLHRISMHTGFHSNGILALLHATAQQSYCHHASLLRPSVIEWNRREEKRRIENKNLYNVGLCYNKEQ